MLLSELKNFLPENVLSLFSFADLRPAQEKAVNAGLFEDNNLLVCTPTASGKTFIAELGFLNHVLNKKRKAVYIVPLIALANEKFKNFKERYKDLRIALSVGDYDASDSFLIDYDVVICTSEKFDSLIRHDVPWLGLVSLLIVDEIHLINDVSRGPTLEILITLARKLLPKLQVIGLSATIGNAEELAEWLDAKLVVDDWRPVPLSKGVYFNNQIEFID